MWESARRSRVFAPVTIAVVSIVLSLSLCNAAEAGEGTWTFRLEPIMMDIYGHDQHVLNIHEIEYDPPANRTSAVTLDTDAGVAFRGAVEYSTDDWGFGTDFKWFFTSQVLEDQRGAADGESGLVNEVVYEVADRRYTSTSPDEVLYYNLLEDNDVAAWTVDFYAARTIVDSPDGRLRLVLGLRFADFDNDYRAVVGLEHSRGARIDASSNYDRMTGPLIGIAGTLDVGKSSFEASIGQSVLLGSVELSSMYRDFTGPFGETPDFSSEETIHTVEDVAIPVTDLQVYWSYRLSRVFSLGLGVNGSTWWDVPVPPGVKPAEGGNQTLHENTLVFFGIGTAVELRF